MTETTAEVYTTFTHPCPCGETVHVIDGQEQPHEHRPLTVQMIRDAWAEGYEFGCRESGTD